MAASLKPRNGGEGRIEKKKLEWHQELGNTERFCGSLACAISPLIARCHTPLLLGPAESRFSRGATGPCTVCRPHELSP